MLPPKIISYINEGIKYINDNPNVITENNSDHVIIHFPNTKIKITPKSNDDIVESIYIHITKNNKEYYFSSKRYEFGYKELKLLLDTALVKDLDLNFEKEVDITKPPKDITDRIVYFPSCKTVGQLRDALSGYEDDLQLKTPIDVVINKEDNAPFMMKLILRIGL